MKKILLVIAIAIIAVLVSCQPGPRIAKDGSQTFSTIPDWFCNFNFSFNGAVKYTESLNPMISSAQRDELDLTNDNNIDRVSWNGTSCYCWVLLYEDIFFDDNRLGLWAGSLNGTFDLTKYLLSNELDVTRDSWQQWDTEVSSYRIYCF